MTTGPGVDRADDAMHVASAYFETKNYARAREVLRRALAQHPNDPNLLAQLARAEYLLGDYPVAASSSYAALAASPQHELAMRIYTLSLDSLGRRRDALWMAWQGVLAHPNEPLQHRIYARLLQKTWQLRSALQVVDGALRLEPANADALVLRGSILHDLNRIEESDASYRAALELDPANAEALNNMAVNRLQRGKLTRALQGFLGAAGSDPTLGDLARRNIGVVLRKVLVLVTVAAGLLGFLVAFAGVLHSEGQPTGVLRVFAALVTAGLIAVLAWLLRTIPRPVLASVLHKQTFAALRIAHALVAVVAGAWISVFPGPVAIVPVGGILVITGFILFRVGLFTGR